MRGLGTRPPVFQEQQLRWRLVRLPVPLVFQAYGVETLQAPTMGFRVSGQRPSRGRRALWKMTGCYFLLALDRHR